ncbi:extracellular solute-binding protein [Elusimicrobiota bacterium]
MRTLTAAMAILLCCAVLHSAKLPPNLKWLTSNEPTFASDKAQKGGVIRGYLISFPMTLRTVGPDSNGNFRGFITDEAKLTYAELGLAEMHPNTKNMYPALATHWAIGKDKKTVYYKLDQDARWSDGTPVTADDYLHRLEFMRSKEITAPWYNNYYTENFDKIIKFDDHTIAVVLNKAKPDLLYMTSMSPSPKHYYGKLTEDFVTKYNWKIAPNTGPYYIAEVNKGHSVVFRRKKDWWAKDKKYFKYRYNVDKIIIKTIRDNNIAFEHFKNANLDTFRMTIPQFWHIKSKMKEVDLGYVHKLKFYNQLEMPNYAIFINMDKEIFKDKNVRYGFAHAMNIGKVIKAVLRNDYERLESWASGQGEFSNPNIKARKFDLKKVDEYMKKAGWGKRGPDGIRVKDGKRFSVRMSYGWPSHTPRLVVIKEEAKKAGIEIKLQLLDSAAAFKAMLEKKHEVAWGGLSTGIRPAYRQSYHSVNAHKTQTNNFTNTDDPEMDRLIGLYRNSLNNKERAALSKKIIAGIHETGAIIPTFSIPYFREGYWKWVEFPENLTKRNEYVTDYGLFWINKEVKEETLRAFKRREPLGKTIKINDYWKVK